jgi:plastocyanin
VRVPLPLALMAAVALVALVACGGSSPTTQPTSPAGATATAGGATATAGGGGAAGSAAAISCNDGENGTDVSIIDFAFQPAAVTADAGGVVLWTNTGSATHTVTFDNGKDCGSLASGDLLHVLFTAPGTYTYHCSIHSSMKATITVK